jgi:hypothetical protein
MIVVRQLKMARIDQNIVFNILNDQEREKTADNWDECVQERNLLFFCLNQDYDTKINALNAEQLLRRIQFFYTIWKRRN